MSANFATSHHIKAIRPSLDVMESLGFDGEECLEGTGIEVSQLTHPDATLSLQQELRFFRNLIRISGDSTLGLKLGEVYLPEVYGILGYALISAPTLRHVLSIASSYGDLTFSMFKLESAVNGKTVSFTLSPKFKMDDDVLMLASDRDVSASVLAFSEVLQRKMELKKVSLAHNNVAHLKQYESYFGCPVDLKQENNQLQFEAEYLDQPLPRQDAETSALCQQQCQLLIAQLSNQSSFVDDVRQMILARPGYFPDIDYLAEKIGVSTRTLRRRLKREGSSYQQLLNEIRYELAREYLTKNTMQLEMISQLLGYSDPGNFSHAFKRWSGVSPRQWRAQNS